MSNFETLYKLNVNDRVEKKDGLSYLSWAWAWAEFKKVYPSAVYEVVKSDAGLPYFESDAGAMVYTRVTADELTHEMWLPVMDSKNKAMKKAAYSYSTRNGEKTVDAFTMFDVNKTIMRCLVKNFAMFGLGLYIYAGEDLPEVDVEPIDIAPLADKLQASTDLKNLQSNWKEVYKVAFNDQNALKELEKIKDEMKNLLQQGAAQ